MGGGVADRLLDWARERLKEGAYRETISAAGLVGIHGLALAECPKVLSKYFRSAFILPSAVQAPGPKFNPCRVVESYRR